MFPRSAGTGSRSGGGGPDPSGGGGAVSRERGKHRALRKLAREPGDARARPYGGGGGSLIEAARDTIFRLLEENPALATETLRGALRDCGFVFGYGTVCSFLQRHGFKPMAAVPPAFEPIHPAVEFAVQPSPVLLRFAEAGGKVGVRTIGSLPSEKAW